MEQITESLKQQTLRFNLRAISAKVMQLFWSVSWLQTMRAYRCWQGLNLRGETPMDFKSIALTTRPQQPERDSFLHFF